MGEQLYRKTYRVDLVWQLQREYAFLQKLSLYHGFPRTTGWAEGVIWMSHCGRPVKEVVKGGLSVKQVEDQLAVLLFTLVREGIKHRDITADNLLWHPERGLYLVDFGWSTWVGEDDSPIPVPHVMRPWMCALTAEEQVVETLKKLRVVEAPKQ